ncbi:hypothetical protein Dimus_038217 [Dionaea muscipula]
MDCIYIYIYKGGIERQKIVTKIGTTNHDHRIIHKMNGPRSNRHKKNPSFYFILPSSSWRNHGCHQAHHQHQRPATTADKQATVDQRNRRRPVQSPPTSTMKATIEVVVAYNVEATSEATIVGQQICPKTTPFPMTPSHIHYRRPATPNHSHYHRCPATPSTTNTSLANPSSTTRRCCRRRLRLLLSLPLSLLPAVGVPLPLSMFLVYCWSHRWPMVGIGGRRRLMVEVLAGGCRCLRVSENGRGRWSFLYLGFTLC